MQYKADRQRLIDEIETAREKLNNSIETKEDYDKIYQYSTALDHLIEQYIVAGF